MISRVNIVRHWLAVTLAGVTLMVGVLSLIQSVRTIGDPFAGFFFGPNLLVSITQRASWPGVQMGLKSLERIVSVNGERLADGPALIEKISAAREGEIFTYQITDRNGFVRNVAVPVTRHSLNDFLIGFLAPFLMGLLFLFFAVILFFAQPDAPASFVYLCFSCVIGAFCMTLYDAYASFLFFRVTLIYPLIGALSAHLFSLFPANRILRPRVRAVVWLVYGIAGSLVVWRQLAMWSPEKSAWLSKLSSAYVLIILSVDALLLVRAFQMSVHQAARDRIKVTAVGLLIACSVVAYWSLNFLRITQSFHLDEGVLLASVFPLFMAYAILKRNVFNLDRVIRITLSYGISAAAVLTLYLLVIGGLRAWQPSATQGHLAGWMLVLLAGLGAVLFNVLLKRANQWVHRILFKSHYDVGTAIAELDRSLRAGVTRSDVAEGISEHLTKLLQLERTAVICVPNESNDHPLARFSGWNDPQPLIDPWLALFETEGFLQELVTYARPLELADLIEERPEKFQRSIETLRAHLIEVLLPLVSSGKLYGFVLLGRKLSTERYDSVDFRLLQSVGARIATILENTDLTQGIQGQARLAALGKMASIIIHDVRNPLSTIRTAAGSLKRRFREGDHSHELAQIIEEEVDRMNRTISEILSFAKPPGLSLSPQSLSDLAVDVVKRLKPHFDDLRINLVLDLCSEDTALNLDESLVRRAVENLLANAREATPPGGDVRVKTRTFGNGNGITRISLIVEDTGIGMDPSVREKVFEPFYTTKPAGTGLGLALVKQIMLQHQGEIDLETKPGQGTRFTLHFPGTSDIK